MANISGRRGSVSSTSGFFAGIKEWNLTNNYEVVDVTEFSESNDTEARDFVSTLKNGTNGLCL